VNRSPVAFLIWLLLRGLYLWVLVPVGAIAGLLLYGSLRRQEATLGQFIGWLDLIVMAAVFHSILRPFGHAKDIPWIPWSEVRTVSHRVRIFGDLVIKRERTDGLDRKFDMK